MKIEGLIWLPEIVDKLWNKHGVSLYEVEYLLESNPFFNKIGNGNVKGEDLYRALGKTSEGRYLAVFFIYKATCEALVISARDMSKNERKNYGKKK